MSKLTLEQFQAQIATIKDKPFPIIKTKDPLNLNNFTDWRFVITNQFITFDWYKFIESDYETTVYENVDFKRIDRYLLSQIGNNVTMDIRRDFYHLESGREAWFSIINRFDGSNHVKCLRAFRQLFELISNKNQDLNVMLSKFNGFVNDVNMIFPNQNKDVWIGMLFALLPDKYHYLSSLIRARSDIKLNEAIEFISTEIQIKRETSKTNNNNHLNQNNHQNKSNIVSANYGQTINKKSKNKLFCRYCKSNDHIIKDCKILKAKQNQHNKNNQSDQHKSNDNDRSELNENKFYTSNQQQQQQQQSSNNNQSNNDHQISTTNNGNLIVHAWQIKVVNIGSVDNSLKRDKWYFDSGAEQSTSNNLLGCTQLVETDNIYVNSAHGNTHKALGIGKFEFQTGLGNIIQLNDVIVDTSLEASYLSGGVLDKKGFKFIGGGGKIEIYTSSNQLVAVGYQINSTLYEMDFRVNINLNSLSTGGPKLLSLEDWHLKLGHLNIQDVKRILNHYKIKFINSSSDFKCEYCLLAKFTIKPFQSSISKSSDILELIHSDLSGIIRIKNVLSKFYFVVFIDDFSRLSFVYLLKRKSDLFEVFIQFKKWIELKTNRKIKTLRSDNGTEYANNLFSNLAKETGIELQYSVARRQQQNGVSERLMRTLVEMARCILLQSKVNLRFWPYAITYSSYIRNRSPCSSINYQIPIKLFFNIDPNLHSLVPFGSTVVIKNDDHSNKFSPRGLKGIILGFEPNHKAYTVYLPELDKIVASRDVSILNIKSNDFIDCEPVELIEEEDVIDDTCLLNDSVQIYEDGSINHLIKDITIENNSELNLNNTSSNLNDNEDLLFSENKFMLSNDNQPNQSSNQSDLHNRENNNQNHQPIDNYVHQYKTGDTVIFNNREEREAFLCDRPYLQLKYSHPSRNQVTGAGRSVYKVLSISTPRSFDQAIESPEAEQWAIAMLTEINCLEMNGTWEIVDRPQHQIKIVPGMWLFTVKYNGDFSIDKFKARWVANGKVIRDDNLDCYSPVLRSSSFNILLSLAVNLNMEVYQLDVQTAYLNAKLEEEVYMAQPYGFSDGNPNHICKLLKSIYGLQQSGKNWFYFIVDKLERYGLSQLYSEQCLFKSDNGDLFLGLYSDDICIATKSKSNYTNICNHLKQYVKLTEKGIMEYCLGINVLQSNSKILINQSTSIVKLLEETNLLDCNAARTPMFENIDLESANVEFEDKTSYRRIIGILLYISLHTRPDIAFAVARLCKFISNPMVVHYEALKHILRYLKGTINYSLKFTNSNQSITAYADADHGNYKDSKSISGNLVYLFGNLIFWQSKRQNYVAAHSCEAELLSIRESLTFVIYLRNLARELNLTSLINKPTIIYNDNNSTVLTLKDGGSFMRNRHYIIRINFIRDYIRKKFINVQHLPGNQMIADGLTKPLGHTLFKKFIIDLKFEDRDFNQI